MRALFRSHQEYFEPDQEAAGFIAELPENTEANEDTWIDGWAYVVRAFDGAKCRFDLNLHPIGGAALSFVVFFLLRLFWPLWTFSPYIPFLCPIYGEGQNWLASPYFEAITCHIFAGGLALSLCVFQFNKSLRQRFPTMHRWNGRLYVLTGTACVFALQPPQKVVGQGNPMSARTTTNLYMQAMVIASSLLWLVFTGRGVLAARQRQFQHHKLWMMRSAAVLSVPMTQRFLSAVWLCPSCIGLHLLFYGWRWQASHQTSAPRAGEGVEDVNADSAGEVTLSLEGWGRAEEEVFALR